jgi:hypothetical protein
MGLKPGFAPLPPVAPVATTTEMEERILGADAYVRKDVLTEIKTEPAFVSPVAQPAAVATEGIDAPLARRKEPTVLMNAKLPLRLHSRLKRTAQFNDLSMTDILIRAIEAELATGRYAAPPEVWGAGSD